MKSLHYYQGGESGRRCLKLGICLLSILIFFTGGLTFSSAHQNGTSIEKIIDDTYIVDIGYSPDKLLENTQARLDFGLLDASTNEEVLFDDIWLRIEKNGEVYFAGGIDAALYGGTILLYRFHEAGEYNVFVRFHTESQPIIETTVDLTVVEKPAESTLRGLPSFTEQPMLFLVLIGIILFILMCLVVVNTGHKNRAKN